jgi:hypothetical protein
MDASMMTLGCASVLVSAATAGSHELLPTGSRCQLAPVSRPRPSTLRSRVRRGADLGLTCWPCDEMEVRRPSRRCTTPPHSGSLANVSLGILSSESRRADTSDRRADDAGTNCMGDDDLSCATCLLSALSLLALPRLLPPDVPPASHPPAAASASSSSARREEQAESTTTSCKQRGGTEDASTSSSCGSGSLHSLSRPHRLLTDPRRFT